MSDKIYISGKISGLPFLEYTENFRQASIAIHSRYSEFDCAEIINPLDIKPFLGIKSWLCYMCADIWKLRKCTHSVFQKNWVESRGAVIEYYCAKFIFKQQIILLK